MSPVGLVGAGLVALAGGAWLRLLWRASSRAIHPPRGPSLYNLSDYPELRPVAVSVSSGTGVTLAGRLFAGRNRATIVLTHGYGASQDEMLPVANALHAAGFGVFTYDLRGCGQSEGAATFGALEQLDLRSVVDFLVSRTDLDAERIGALGFSVGAATTIMAAAHDPRIKAVVADSAWSDVYRWLRPSLRAIFLHPRDPFSVVSLKLVERRTGIDLDRLRPGDEVAAVSPRPILLVHGGADEVVAPADGELIYAAAREPKELWLVPGAGHTETIRPDGATSGAQISAFFERSLLAQN